jgi:hypothetical protein
MTERGRTLIAVAVVLGNFVLCGFGFLMAARLFYGGRPQPAVMAICFLVFGSVARLWSAKWWMVVVPAAAGYLWGLGALKWAIHLSDTAGEYAPSISSYVFHPSVSEVVWALIGTAAAGLGWWVTSKLIASRGTATPELRA